MACVSSIRGSRLTLAAHASPEKSTLTTRHCILMRTPCSMHQALRRPCHPPRRSFQPVNLCVNVPSLWKFPIKFHPEFFNSFSNRVLSFFLFNLYDLLITFYHRPFGGSFFFWKNFNKLSAPSVFVTSSTVLALSSRSGYRMQHAHAVNPRGC